MYDPVRRRAVLESLLAFDGTIAELQRQVSLIGWGYPVELVALERKHIRDALKRLLAGEIDAQNLQDWAEMIELREDIAFPDEIAKESMFLLANLHINWPLGEDQIRSLIAENSD
jgi:hypothetical protein